MHVGGTERPRVLAWQFVWLQLLAVEIIALAGLIFCGPLVSFSTVSGGLVCVLSNVVFVFRAFRHLGGSQARLMAHGFYFGQAAKLLAVAGLCWLVWSVIPVNPLAFFVGLIGVQLTSFWAPSLIGA